VAEFTVDPRIFRELGELLVKRDSIALTELLKNAYDADARTVRVVGEGLDREHGSVLIVDDGVGMTAAQFRTGFLRIASRSKETETRRSVRYGRRYTGEKGIGRLSAHKLGAVLDVESAALKNARRNTGDRLVRARIDWDRVEDYPSLNRLGRDALRVSSRAVEDRHAGTTIRIGRLRRKWSERELTDFVVEADLFEPPEILMEPVDELVRGRLIFDRPRLRDSKRAHDRFAVSLEGDFDAGERLWQSVPSAAWWVIEIDARSQQVVYRIAPTERARDASPDADVEEHVLETRNADRPRFQARIFAREGVRARRDRGFASQVAGVRVYMEGFRISPYGERGDDWLGLDADYTRRDDHLRLDLPGLRGQVGAPREGLRTLPNNAYVGAVLLTHRGAPALLAPIDREGFLPSAQLDALAHTVRVGVDLLTRIRARLGLAEGEQRQGQRALRRAAEAVFLADEIVVRDGLVSAVATARGLRTSLAAASADTEIADTLVEDLGDLANSADRVVGDRALLRVLASAGTQMAAFVHEIENVVSSARTLDVTLSRLAERHHEAASSLNVVRRNLATLRGQVERQAGFLTDVASAESRRRRSRQSVAERLQRSWELVEPAAARLDVEFVNEVDPSMRTPPMFPAEVTMVLTNLMTNAVKAAGKGGTIYAASRSDEQNVLRLENSGKQVHLAKSERWFLPFESTTLQRIDPLLGQGMGLGLAITRSVLDDYRSTIKFVKPARAGMKTAVEVRFP
jgi:signal transduction histidine kinase